MQSGRHVAGEPPRRFRYRNKATMATMGRSSAAAEPVLDIELRGVPAWLAYDRGPRLILREHQDRRG